MTSFIKQENNHHNTFIVYYQGFLAVGAVIIFFTKLDVYLGKRGMGIPLWWAIAFMVASFPLFTSIFSRLRYIPTSIFVWCVAYLAMPLISILILPGLPEIQLLEDQIRSILFLILMLVIFSQHPLVLRWVKRTLFSLTFLNILMFIYEFFNPSAFHQQQHAPGRSSGFYIDANSAGASLILGMIFTIDLIKPKYRLFYALFVFVGIASTFSRGAMLGWLIVILLFMAKRVIPLYQLPIFVLSIFLSITILASQMDNLSRIKTADGTELFNEGTLARVEFLIDPFGQEDDSSEGRLGYVDETLSKFESKPFLGNGLGSGATSNASDIGGSGQVKRSHNTYLDQMVEYGFLGALIYPGLLFATVWKAQGELKKYTLPFVAFLLAWGLFSHTTLNSFWLLTSYAIMANITQQSRLESNQS